jgi:hypothetical protein
MGMDVTVFDFGVLEDRLEDFEPPRVYRRLHFLRGWSYEQVNEIFAGSSGAGCTVGV